MSNPTVSYSLDVAGALAIVGAFGGVIPPVAALCAALWYLVQIYESSTIQNWLQQRRLKHRAHKLARLKAAELVLLAEIDAIEKVRVAKAYGVERVLEAKNDAAKGMVRAELVEDPLDI